MESKPIAACLMLVSVPALAAGSVPSGVGSVSARFWGPRGRIFAFTLLTMDGRVW